MKTISELTAKLRALDKELNDQRNDPPSSFLNDMWIAAKTPAGPYYNSPLGHKIFILLRQAANCGAFDAPHFISFKRIISRTYILFQECIVAVLDELELGGFNCWKPATESAADDRPLLKMADAFDDIDASGAVKTTATLPHLAAFAMLGIEGRDNKSQSKIMERIRTKASGALICEKRGTVWFYDPTSWAAIVRLIGEAGGVNEYTPTPGEIAEEKRKIHASRPK
ncbi:MAG: hypothetical protein ABSG31_18985 [Tepidisphaeraceae bacterium]|jgi:hypothetical protein